MKEWIARKKVIVCCGAGGVGKTTLSAALAVESARQGYRTLVLTVDPSLRLAQALRVQRNSSDPVTVSAEVLGESLPEGGSLEAWMLDPRVVADRAVISILGRERKSQVDAERFLRNRIYTQISKLVSGMQEYTALKALGEFIDSGRYDRIILDTPPSRHALDFLDAPSRVAEFLEGRIFQMFVPVERGWLGRAAGSVVEKVVSTVFGENFSREMREFIGLFSGVFQYLNADLSRVREFLAGPDAGFVVVTSPRPAPLDEAQFFLKRAEALKLPVLGLVINQWMEGAVRSQTGSTAAKSPLQEKLIALENHWVKQEQAALHEVKDLKGVRYFVPWIRPDLEVAAQLREIVQRASVEMSDQMDPLRKRS